MRWARLLLCGVALVMAPRARAQDGLTVGLEVGLNGSYVGRRWNVATVTVSNPGLAVRGTLQIEMRRPGYGETEAGPPDASYSMPVSAPTGESRFRTALLAPAYGGTATLRFASGGTILFEDTWSLDDLADVSYYLVLAITERQDTAWIGEGAGDLVVLAPTEAPADARAYDAASCILLDMARLDDIPPPARRGILQRTSTGGLLVLSAPFLAENARDPGLAALTYVDPREGALFVHPSIDAAAIFAPRADLGAAVRRVVPCDPHRTDVVAASDAGVIVFEHSLGAGRVRGLTVDPEWMQFASPADELSFQRSFWSAALEGSGSMPFRRSDLPWSLVPAESRLGRLGTPLLIYLGILIVVMGPLNFLLLRRVRRREWLVVTAPVAALVFVVAAVVMSPFLHRDQPLSVHQSITVLSAGTPTGGTVMLDGVLSTRTRSYDVELPRADLPLREFQEEWMPRYEGHHLPPLHLGPSGMAIRGMRVKRWTMRAVHYPAVVTEGSVHAKLDLDGSGLRGWIHSELPVALSDCTLLHKWHNTTLGSIRPGEIRKVRLPLGPPELSERELRKVQPLTDLKTWLSWDLWDAGGDHHRWYLARSTAEEVLSDCADPLLIGWGPPPARGPQVRESVATAHEQHLYVVRLPVAASGPTVEMPVGAALTSTTGSWSAWPLRRWWGEDRSELRKEREGMIVEFFLPLETAVRHDRLSVHGRFAHDPGEGLLPQQRLSVYNWREHEWQTITESLQQQFQVRVPEPEAAIMMPRGLVRVRLQSSDGDDGDLSGYALEWIDLSYRGEHQSR
ncbi:MAG: hypothetical protein U9R79_05010 [Armatimonadota bacterium]|nr:hypothetical protein [Armatimonadota bacterium]